MLELSKRTNHNKKRTFPGSLFIMVGPERLELSHIAALDPKSSASTNFATGPCIGCITNVAQANAYVKFL